MNRISNKDINAAFMHLQSSTLSKGGQFKTLYEIPKELDYEFCRNKERGLQKITDNMLQFVGPIGRAFLTLDKRASKMNIDDQVFIVSPKGETITEKNKISALYKDKAGEYRMFNNGFKEILVTYNPKFYLQHYLAILAHEMAHHVLEEYRVNPPIFMDNETFTDITAIYLGFGILLCKGYAGGIAFEGGIGYIDRSTVYNATSLWFVLKECPISNVFNNFHFIEPERYELLFGILRRKIFHINKFTSS